MARCPFWYAAFYPLQGLLPLMSEHQPHAYGGPLASFRLLVGVLSSFTSFQQPSHRGPWLLNLYSQAELQPCLPLGGASLLVLWGSKSQLYKTELSASLPFWKHDAFSIVFYLTEWHVWQPTISSLILLSLYMLICPSLSPSAIVWGAPQPVPNGTHLNEPIVPCLHLSSLHTKVRVIAGKMQILFFSMLAGIPKML